MRLVVQRVFASANSVTGDLQVDGNHRGFTLEPPHAPETVKPRCITAGTYDLTIRWSNRFQRLMPHVENVPGFDGVLIHWGNYPKDTEACLLVGETTATDFVGNSRKCFDERTEWTPSNRRLTTTSAGFLTSKASTHRKRGGCSVPTFMA